MDTGIPPTIEQVQRAQQDPPRLYDVHSIDLATFLGSWFAGAILLSRNLQALGRVEDARSTLIVGFFGLIALAFAIYSIVVPERFDRLVGLAVQAAQVAAVHVLSTRTLGRSIERHRAAGGAFYSRWRAAGVSVLVLPITIGVIVAVAIFFPGLPALAPTD